MRDYRDQGIVSSLIIFALVLMVVFSVTGCSTAVPVTAKFPDPPAKGGATALCPNLQKLKEAPVLSDISKTVNVNYGTYYECAVKVDTWNEWYQIQKNIFEGAVK